jgi:TetR/AcrR family transcriptional regulator
MEMKSTESVGKKQMVILEAARKRFAMYGIEKTTMQDIAGDLGMAKGSIYYYYSDKENLYKAVIESEHSEFLRNIENDLARTSSPVKAIEKFVINRLSYFRKLVNLSRMSLHAASEYRPLITETMVMLREKEKVIIMEILDSGNKSGIFRVENTYETASLYLDLLRGLRSVVLRDKTMLILDEKEYDELTSKALSFTKIFVNGLKFKTEN